MDKPPVLTDEHLDEIEARIDAGEVKGMNETLNALLERQRDDTYQKTLEMVGKWMDEYCPHVFISGHTIHRRDCYLCRAELEKKALTKEGGE